MSASPDGGEPTAATGLGGHAEQLERLVDQASRSTLQIEPYGALRRIRERQTFAVAIVPLFIGVGLLNERFQAVLADLSAPDLPIRIASLVLVIGAFAYFVSWYFGSTAEIDAAEDIGPGAIVFVPTLNLPIIIAAAVLLGLLGLLSSSVLAFGLILFALKLVELFASWDMQTTVRANTTATLATGPELWQRAAISAAGRYYVDSPWVRSTAIMLGLLGASVSLGGIAAATSSVSTANIATVAAAALALAGMGWQEWLTWRRRRRYLQEIQVAVLNRRHTAGRRPSG